ncbi:endonuclease [Pseudomonas sp. C27(2019)]|uniref:endonuclease/exonuclease/phosphatase family protein n=1 Tax=Pseudomonas sp. C27(2019) TaxID=2604941 RepID=UPI0012450850|nr:endonuclease/exonuclease/phosphatase family protein [Pseudomonas sp. C27(2019)]QEY59717.1 endonuclease [Pseudomonas sp. C27(2019)]
MLMISAVTTLCVVIATVLPLSKNPHWWVRGLDFPRLQIAALAAGLLIVHCVFLDLNMPLAWLLIAATALCFVWQLCWVLPYTLIWPHEVKTAKSADPDRQLSIITANVLQTNRNSDALIDLVSQHQPDILVTLESSQWWQDRLEVLATEMPHSVKCPLENLYGMHVYSRLPFSQEQISYLVEDGVPSIHLCLQLRSGDTVQMHFVHPAPPSPTENSESIERDAELIVIAKRVAETEQPVIVTGDLNDVAWSATTRLFRKISGLLDPRVGRGMFNTFHVSFPFLRWPLDHLFHSSHFTVKHIQRLPSIGSDHFSLFTKLVYEPAECTNQEGLSATADDHTEAKRVAQKKDVSKEDVPKLSH